MWQDYVFTFCGILFSYSIIPQIFRNYKLKDVKGISWQLIGSCYIGVSLSLIAFSTLELYLSSVLCCVQLLCWGIVIGQKIYYKKEIKKS